MSFILSTKPGSHDSLFKDLSKWDSIGKVTHLNAGDTTIFWSVVVPGSSEDRRRHEHGSRQQGEQQGVFHRERLKWKVSGFKNACVARPARRGTTFRTLVDGTEAQV